VRKTQSSSRFPRSNQLAWGTLNRYLLIPRRLTFESRVRVGSPRLAAAPLALRFGRGFLPVRLQIISFSCLSSAPLSCNSWTSDLGRLTLEPGLVHRKSISVAQDDGPLNYIL